MVTQLEAIRAVVEAVKGKGYARKVFDQKPEWSKALGEVAKGMKNSASRTQHFARGGEQ